MAHPRMPGDDATVKPVGSPLRLEPLSASLVPAVDAFHARLEAQGGPPYRFGTRVDTAPDAASPPMRMETWVAVDGEQVRGGIMVQHLWVDSATGRVPAVNIQLPLSEGTVDRRYSHVGAWLIRSVQRREPRVFAVGMGSMDQPLPQLLAALRWAVVPVPFFFHVHRPFRFLREMPMLRRSTARRLLAGAAAWTGVGFIGVRAGTAVRTLLRRGMRRLRTLDVRALEEWGPWATDIWERVHAANSLAVLRDEASLRALYPPVGDRTRCYRVDEGGRAVGWFVLLTTRMHESAYFGNLHVGTILDAQALEGFESHVLAAARRTLYTLGVDLSVTNQLHATWQRACEENGYWQGPSNFLFAASPALLKAAGGDAGALARVHLTRGDGDGRIHL